jgi:hypothetical protein
MGRAGACRLCIFVVAVSLAVCSVAFESSAAISQKADGRTLLATVVDRTGRTQVDLGIDDFVVDEGGQRDVIDVHIADYPVVVLVDTGNAPALRVMKQAADRFITRIGVRPVGVAALSTGSMLDADFGDDRADVLARVASLVPGTSDAAVALATVARAAQLLRETGAPFSAIVIVAASSIDATQPVRGELLPVITESGASVHVVAGRPSSGDSRSVIEAPDLLKVLAEQSRGEYTPIFSSASYSVALDRLADRLAAEIMVEYLVPAGSKAGDVRVGVRRPGARVVGLGVSR